MTGPEIPTYALPAWVRALRPWQWVKNLLLIVPLVLAHRVFEPALALRAVVAIAAFSLVASAGYVLNDLRDADADRLHPRKRFRPFASGELSAGTGWVLAAVSAAGGVALAAAFLPMPFLVALLSYFAASLTYSAVLKAIPLLDVLGLAGLYTLRLFAGGLAVDVPVSTWLFAFSMFLFLSLAVVKRYSELTLVHGRDGSEAPGRGYRTQDRRVLGPIGIASGFLAVLVLALYVTGEDVRALYRRPEMLLLICPPLLYWIARLWLLAGRGELHDDPVLFTLRDPASWAVGAVAAAVLVVSV